MLSSISPELFNYIAITFARFKWQLLAWSIFFFVLFIGLQSQIQLKTPSVLVWLAILILFVAIESLVVAAFMFFFQVLPSTREENLAWFKFYRTIEWCETILFTILLPLPIVLFIYAFVRLAI
ncbi:hypothetical protein [Cognaticolwellia beringensis]|uniref:Uncharacterized protein n=1 Tax=Cognaticolwellia beringensis TaxID=1967665 RepID=A0A222GBH3_9GAMM|nr:hypothetical protein [Cognaticolwellia beringensis]ASP49003.1 hypothetical protein B5D82_15230 [Cognaticolwellia beringensis]